jgi:arylsulfate sulfotransferase
MMKAWLIIFSVVLTLTGSAAPHNGQLVGSAVYTAGPNPFISFARLRVSDTTTVEYARFQIQPKAGSATRPVNVKYSRQYLLQRGYINSTTGKVTVPVFGLYAGRSNSVTITIGFSDGTSQKRDLAIQTATYDLGTYSNPTVLQSRLPGTTLSYDFILLKNFTDPVTPIIIDSDAEIRWVGTAGVGVVPSAFFDNAFYLASGTSLLRTEFDGTTTTVADYSALGVTGIDHNIDPGRDGVILEVNTAQNFECVNYEVDAAGNVLKTWNLADIISAAMIAGGDDPGQFVAIGATVDWFHNNATTYRASDNSLIVSSRENFVIALDYDSGAIKWILGEPTKKWYEFPSLRAFALKLGFDTLPPIGQHAISISQDQLLLFDNGTASLFQMPPGETRTYSAPRKYQIDLTHFRATEVWHYLADPGISSPFCSSVYEDAKDNYLIDYTVGGPYLFTELVGLDGGGNVAFDYRYDVLGFCGTAWNAIPIHWEKMQLK